MDNSRRSALRDFYGLLANLTDETGSANLGKSLSQRSRQDGFRLVLEGTDQNETGNASREQVTVSWMNSGDVLI